MVATAPSAPSSLAGPPAQGRSASRSASDRRGLIRAAPENDGFGRLERSHLDRRVAASCIGRARPHHGASHRGRRRFSSQTRGRRYCRARYYHPQLHRFIAEDPHVFLTLHGCCSQFQSNSVRIVNEPLGWSLYAYAANRPLDLKDPLGLVSVDRGHWRCGSRLCLPYRIEEGSGRLVKGIRCRYNCRSAAKRRCSHRALAPTSSSTN